MASYTWLKIDESKDYEQLVCILDSEFEPKSIAETLSQGITSRVKAVLVEYDYLDKDYRSTLYNFYAKRGVRIGLTA